MNIQSTFHQNRYLVSVLLAIEQAVHFSRISAYRVMSRIFKFSAKTIDNADELGFQKRGAEKRDAGVILALQSDELLVEFRINLASHIVKILLRQKGITQIRKIDEAGRFVVKVPDGKNVSDIATVMHELKSVRWVQGG